MLVLVYWSSKPHNTQPTMRGLTMDQMTVHQIDWLEASEVGQWIVDGTNTRPEFVWEAQAKALAYAWGRHDGAMEVYSTGGTVPVHVDSWTFSRAFLLTWALEGLRGLPSLSTVWAECTK